MIEHTVMIVLFILLSVFWVIVISGLMWGDEIEDYFYRREKKRQEEVFLQNI